MQDTATRLGLENDVRTTLLQGLAGALFLATAFFSWRQIQVTREGQITDRYAKAVEMLDSEGVSVRAGAVHALGRVARDSPGDRAAIMQLLCAFARTRSSQVFEGLGLAAHQDRLMLTRGLADEATLNRALLPVDLEAALRILGDVDIFGERGGRAELADLFAVRAPLADVHLPGANLSGAVLYRSDLAAANLVGSDFSGADLRYANLEGADLRNATFTGAVLTDAMLGSASLQNADLNMADLTGANLINANLAGAQLGMLKKLRGALYDHGTVWPNSHKASGEECDDVEPVPVRTHGSPDHWHHD